MLILSMINYNRKKNIHCTSTGVTKNNKTRKFENTKTTEY